MNNYINFIYCRLTTRIVFALVLPLVLLQLGGCEKRIYQNVDVINDSFKKIVELQQFQSLFVNTDYQLINITDNGNSEYSVCGTTGLYDKYWIVLYLTIELNDKRNGIISYSDPVIYLKEVNSINGRKVISSNSWCIKNKLWQVVVNNEGDFSSIGLDLIKDNPVDNFELIYNFSPPVGYIRYTLKYGTEKNGIITCDN